MSLNASDEYHVLLAWNEGNILVDLEQIRGDGRSRLMGRGGRTGGCFGGQFQPILILAWNSAGRGTRRSRPPMGRNEGQKVRG
jgi:hypothetical protein